MSMERSKAGTKKEVPMACHYLIKYNINNYIKAVFYKTWKNCNEIQLTKHKMEMNNQKIKNHSFFQRLTY